MIGQTLKGRYRIASRLGKGAMGAVYRAVDLQTGSDVAVKIVSSELAIDPEMLERFRREGEALGKLKHPNIVGYQDAFEQDEQYVIVMEYVPGGSLYDLIKAGPLPIERASQIALDLCDALIRAHRLNIIHRDIKPENVLIAEDGTPKLADFGVARLTEGTRMTRTGTKVGTPYYMSPEAWKGETADAQSDIWSLGVVLFEMLSGKVPFDGDSEFTVMTKVTTTLPPDLKKLRKDVPSGIVTIITRMLTREKDQRYQTMREVAVDLERGEPATTPLPAKAKSKSSTESRASRKSFSLSRPIVLIAVVTLLIASLIALNFASSPNNESGSTENVAGTTFEATALQVTPTSSTVPDGTSTPTEQSRDLGIGSTMVSEKDGMMMVFVPEGEFTMGGNDGDSDEKPVHAVFLDAFWIDQTEVTNVMYSMCAEQRACDAPNSARSFTRENYFGNPEYDDYPVINVSWDDANTYCAWAGRRLPSEAEWEKAARGIDAATYPWGNDPPANTLLNYNNAVGDTAEVGSYPAGVSSFGALDMAGNVWEWVSSSFEPYPYDANDGREDLTASGSRILRGASWDSFEIFDIRSSFRGKADPSNAFNILGFRCALSHSAL